MTETPRIYPCPQCQKSIRWDIKNPSRPFCSERCRLIDLGDWAAERYSIPVEEKQDWDVE